MDVEEFITRWTAREGGAERANYQMFLSELCDVLDVPRPDPAGADREQNDYVFERAVRPRGSESTKNPKRIDLYNKGSFILEAKQSRLPGKKNAIPGHLPIPTGEPEQLGRRGVARDWDVMMQNARRQAEGYVFLLDVDHVAPPFIIACDVGHCLELYADFTGTGRAYNQFPDRKGFRVFMEDLRNPEIRERLAQVWTDPHSLDPAKKSARVTRDIARRLAQVSKSLEDAKHNPEDVAHFLMRCLFAMFAEDVDLLPADSFKTLLTKSVDDPAHFPHRLKALWQQMEKGEDFSHVIEARVRHFNGGLFKDTTAFELGREEIAELLAAASHKWTEVDPAIFGTLLEQALNETERRKLGAHYTPRAYVQRLVEVALMEPLRADWQAALTSAEQAKEDDKDRQAVAIVRAYHHQLCTSRVLDPACGTGNFLYVSLELMKKLEGEVLETLARLGEPESMGLERQTVDPHQFLGLELNPRAAAIAELVIWIGYLQQHYRTRSGHPSEPILRAFQNINFGRREGYDAVLVWDGYPHPKLETKDGKPVETYPNARRPIWPEAEFIVGNPPFIGATDLRDRHGDGYTQTLRYINPNVGEASDFVLYWWDRAAELLSTKGTALRRFGLVTTKTISQVFQRPVMERHLRGKSPISIVYAIPNQPWTKATPDAASVRIAMTVARAGEHAGVLHSVLDECNLETDEPKIVYAAEHGVINSDLTVGPDVTEAFELKANKGLCSPGVKLHGAGFIVSPVQAKSLGLGHESGLEKHIRPYRNGRDLTSRSRNVMLIDFFGLSAEEARQKHPATYQVVLERVKPERDTNNRPYRRDNWWLFGENNPQWRKSLDGLSRYIATPETAKHRFFVFFHASILPDNMITTIATDDAYPLAICSSRTHILWALRAGGRQGAGNDPRYTKTRTFDPFPFPDADETAQAKLRAAGEELDAARKKVQADNPDLTLTELYNVLAKVKEGAALTNGEDDVKRRGLVLILKELHGNIDRLTAQAYGWRADLTDNQILERLVALNAERAKEEAAGHVRWLRPEYQVPRFGKGAGAKTGELDLEEKVIAIGKSLPSFPTDRYEQPLAIEALLLVAGRPMHAAELARGFKRGGTRIERRITQVLTTLARYGRVIPVESGKYAASRAA